MISYPWAALVTGGMFALAGVMTLLRHFLLEPQSTHYPKAPVFVRQGIFAFSMVLIFIGLQFIWVFFEDSPNTIPPQPGPSTQFLATALLFYSAVMLGNIVRQRYPEATWKKLDRVHESLNCRDKNFWQRIFS